MVQGDGVRMLTANGGRIFPQSTGDLRGETLGFGMRCPFFGDDGDVVSTIEKDPCSNETSDAAADDKNAVGERGRRFER